MTHTNAQDAPLYMLDLVGEFLYPNPSTSRAPTMELEYVLPLCERYVRAFRTEVREVPMPGDEGTPAYWEAREALAQVKLALGEHARRIGPRALSAMTVYLQTRTNPDADEARAESALLEALREAHASADLLPGSHFRVASNPNPDGIDVDDIETHGTHFQYSPKPAVNVKVHADFRRVDFEALADELGLGERTDPDTGALIPARLAPTGRYVDEDGDVCDEGDEGATPEVLPFGEEWIEARWDLDGSSHSRKRDRSSHFYEGPENSAREIAWENGAERVRELFLDFGSPELVSAGRSGGWACVSGLLDYGDLAAEVQEDEEKLAELALLRDEEKTPELDEAQEERLEELEGEEYDMIERRAELARFLGAWGEWEAFCASTVKEMPRSIAWHCGANEYELEAAEYAAELERVAKVRALVAEHVPVLAGLRVLEDADPEELEEMLRRADAERADPDVDYSDGYADGIRDTEDLPHVQRDMRLAELDKLRAEHGPNGRGLTAEETARRYELEEWAKSLPIQTPHGAPSMDTLDTEALRFAARRVVESWDSGDLASAVRELDLTLQELGEEPDEARLSQLGAAVLGELDSRGFSSPPELDAAGFLVRTPLGDGLARDGFHALHKRAAELGLLQGTASTDASSDSDEPGAWSVDEMAEVPGQKGADVPMPSDWIAVSDGIGIVCYAHPDNAERIVRLRNASA